MRNRSDVSSVCNTPFVFSFIVGLCLILAAAPGRLASAQDERPLLGTTVASVNATSDTPLDVSLPSGFVLSGMVQNADGSPVFVGSVTAQSETQTYRGDILPTAFPPAYRIVLPAGTYKLVATTFVFDVESNMGAGVLLSTDMTEMIAVAGDTTRDIIVPAPPPLFPVSGIVTSSGSLPAVGSVVFESVDGKALSIAPVDGMYNLKLPVGDYNVATILTAGALENPTSSLVLPVGALTVSGPHTFDMTLPATLILAGMVHHNGGTPAALSSVFAVDTAGLPSDPPEAYQSCAGGIESLNGYLFTTGAAFIPETSTTGAYSLPLPPGTYSVGVALALELIRAPLGPRSGYLTFPVPSLQLGLTTNLAQNFLAPPLPATVRIYGTVTDAQGQAVPGARVSAATSMITNTPNATFVTETLTDSTGQYALLTLSGTNYTLVTCPPVTGLDSVPRVPETMRLAPIIMHQQWWHADL